MTQDDYARAIIAEGQRRGVSPRGIQIALATALVESNLTMYANAADPDSLNFPHDAVGSDANSDGLFQQRDPWWGTVADRMDPARSAGLFYAALTRLDYNSDAHTPGWYAQTVQQSAFPDRYDERMGDAVALYNRLAGTPAPQPPAGPQFFPALSHSVFHQHLGEPYVYGGLDCSGLADLLLTALTTGTVDGWTRHVTTESWDPDAPIGGPGPFGSVRVALPLPTNAIATIAVAHHGGGEDSHMNVRIDGELMESNGDNGICSEGHGAMSQTDPYFTDWWAIFGDASTQPEDDLTPDQATMLAEIHACLFNPLVSQSAYRALGEGPRWQLHELIKNDDGMMHQLYVEAQARDGDPGAIAALQAVANADPTQYPDRQEDAAKARRFLASLAAPGSPVAPPAVSVPLVAAPLAPLPPAPAPAAPSGDLSGGLTAQLTQAVADAAAAIQRTLGATR